MNLLERLENSSYGTLEPQPERVQATTDANGFTHHVARWPLVPRHPDTLLRPSILGGCYDRVRLPTAETMRAALPDLGFASSPRVGSPLVFLDTETTGLMGSGAFVFVMGIGYIEGEEFVVEQWTLRGVMAEDRMLAAALERIDQVGGALASFNGSSFDLPLLRRRARVYGMDTAVLDRPHFDLLHVSRRMWKGLAENCRLVTLEQTRLDVHRVGDIDGSLIPNTFWEALRKPDDPGSERRLAWVRMHNHGDVLSLAALIPCLAEAVNEPDSPLAAVRSARHMIAIGDHAAAMERLAPWLEPTRLGLDAAPDLQALAMLGADLLRRLEEHGEAARVLRWVCERFPGDPDACEALAKHLEHRAKDLVGALRVAESSTRPSHGRIARLRRRLGLVDHL